MRFLLDTCIISELTKKKPERRVLDWLKHQDEFSLFLSVITIGEIQQGIVRLPTSHKRAQLTTWLNETLLVVYADLILPIDTTVMLQWGTLTAQLMRQGRKTPVMDALLAATALRHDLILITRNVSDFSQTGVDLINPWDQ